jgi:hypothetical protein
LLRSFNNDEDFERPRFLFKILDQIFDGLFIMFCYETHHVGNDGVTEAVITYTVLLQKPEDMEKHGAFSRFLFSMNTETLHDIYQGQIDSVNDRRYRMSYGGAAKTQIDQPDSADAQESV